MVCQSIKQEWAKMLYTKDGCKSQIRHALHFYLANIFSMATMNNIILEGRWMLGNNHRADMWQGVRSGCGLQAYTHFVFTNVFRHYYCVPILDTLKKLMYEMALSLAKEVKKSWANYCYWKAKGGSPIWPGGKIFLQNCTWPAGSWIYRKNLSK